MGKTDKTIPTQPRGSLSLSFAIPPQSLSSLFHPKNADLIREVFFHLPTLFLSSSLIAQMEF